MLLLGGCSQPNLEEPSPNEDSLFGPTAMRIHPIFTQVKDWTGDGRPDGIETLLEFTDQFGDPTKAAGTVMFELYAYRQAEPDPRGKRLANPWFGSIASRREQEARWNPTSRTYTFQIAYPQIDRGTTYVLTAEFRSVDGRRFFDRVVLEGQEAPVAPSAQPAIQPSTQPTTEPTAQPATEPATLPAHEPGTAPTTAPAAQP
jgi:hypothetical protein